MLFLCEHALKWNKIADAAIAQTKNKKYPDTLQGYNNMSLVGINYDKESKEHERVIKKNITKINCNHNLYLLRT